MCNYSAVGIWQPSHTRPSYKEGETVSRLKAVVESCHAAPSRISLPSLYLVRVSFLAVICCHTLHTAHQDSRWADLARVRLRNYAIFVLVEGSLPRLAPPHNHHHHHHRPCLYFKHHHCLYLHHSLPLTLPLQLPALHHLQGPPHHLLALPQHLHQLRSTR